MIIKMNDIVAIQQAYQSTFNIKQAVLNSVEIANRPDENKPQCYINEEISGFTAT